MLAAGFGVGQVVWSTLWIFLFVLWLMLLLNVIGDLIRDRRMSGVTKALWLALLIFLPYLGVFLYLVVRGGKMHDNAVASARAQEAAVEDYIRGVAGPSPADELARLAALRDQGVIDDAELARLKQRIIG